MTAGGRATLSGVTEAAPLEANELAATPTVGVIMVTLGRLESNQRGTYFQSTVLVEAKTAQVVPHTLTHHEHSTSKLHGAPTHSTAHTKHK